MITIDLVLGVAASLIAGISAGLATWAQLRQRRKRVPTLEDRITTLARNLELASAVISEIESEISQRHAVVEKLREDAKRYEQLKALNEDEVKAIVSTIREVIAGRERRSWYINAVIAFFIALLFFVIGLAVGRA